MPLPLAPPATRADAAICVSSVGPGIAPPPTMTLPQGLPGWHATWYGQSGYMSLCPGDTSVATVAYYNTGSNRRVLRPLGPAPFPRANGPGAGLHQPRTPGGGGP